MIPITKVMMAAAGGTKAYHLLFSGVPSMVDPAEHIFSVGVVKAEDMIHTCHVCNNGTNEESVTIASRFSGAGTDLEEKTYTPSISLTDLHKSELLLIPGITNMACLIILFEGRNDIDFGFKALSYNSEALFAASNFTFNSDISSYSLRQPKSIVADSSGNILISALRASYISTIQSLLYNQTGGNTKAWDSTAHPEVGIFRCSADDKLYFTHGADPEFGLIDTDLSLDTIFKTSSWAALGNLSMVFDPGMGSFAGVEKNGYRFFKSDALNAFEEHRISRPTGLAIPTWDNDGYFIISSASTTETKAIYVTAVEVVNNVPTVKASYEITISVNNPALTASQLYMDVAEYHKTHRSTNNWECLVIFDIKYDEKAYVRDSYVLAIDFDRAVPDSITIGDIDLDITEVAASFTVSDASKTQTSFVTTRGALTDKASTTTGTWTKATTSTITLDS